MCRLIEVWMRHPVISSIAVCVFGGGGVGDKVCRKPYTRIPIKRQQQLLLLNNNRNARRFGQVRPGERGSGETAEGSEEQLQYPENITLANLGYFLLLPTLCYQTSYPTNTRFRGRWFARRLVELLVYVGLMLFITDQYIVPTIHNSLAPLHESNLVMCAERLLKLALPTLYWWLVMFYLLFHVWLNVLAEMTGFADREFYKVGCAVCICVLCMHLCVFCLHLCVQHVHPLSSTPQDGKTKGASTKHGTRTHTAPSPRAGLVECNDNRGVLAPMEPASAQVDAAARLLPIGANGHVKAGGGHRGVFHLGCVSRAAGWGAAAHAAGVGIFGYHGAGSDDVFD